MKKLLLLVFSFAVPFFLMNCSEGDLTVARKESRSVKIAIATFSGFDTIAQAARYRVSASDMNPLEGELWIEDSLIVGTVPEIPTGAGRLFEIWVYGYDSSLCYYGSAVADIRPSDTTYVNIQLTRPNGTAVIIGTIQNDTLSGSETISKPQTPYIIDVSYMKSYPPIPRIIFYTGGATSSLDHELSYRWFIEGDSGVVDTVFMTEDTLSKYLTYDFFNDGYYEISVQAVCSQHMNVTSPGSDPMCVTIKNGVLQDTSITVPPVITLIGPDTISVLKGNSFNDPGAKAYDAIDGDLSSTIVRRGHIDTDVAGIYSLIYYVMNSAGISSTASRTVFVYTFDRSAMTVYGNDFRSESAMN